MENEEHLEQIDQSNQKASEKTALIPLYTRQVDFHGDEITVVLVEERGQRQVYVLLRPLCTYLGLSWSSQLQRLREDDVLSEATTSVLLSNTEVGHRQRYMGPDIFTPRFRLFRALRDRKSGTIERKVLLESLFPKDHKISTDDAATST